MTGEPAALPLLQMALRVEQDIFVIRQRGREVAARGRPGTPGPGSDRHRAQRGRPGPVAADGGADVSFHIDAAPTAGSTWVPTSPRWPRCLTAGTSRSPARCRRLVDTLSVGDRRGGYGREDVPTSPGQRADADPGAARRVPRRARPQRAGQRAGRVDRAERAAHRRPRRGAQPARRAGRAQRGAGRDQPGRAGALQPAHRGAGGDQPRRRRPLRRAGREVGPAAGGERVEEPVPGEREPRAARPGHRDHRAGPAAHRLRLRPAHRRAGPPGRSDPLLGGGPARPGQRAAGPGQGGVRPDRAGLDGRRPAGRSSANCAARCARWPPGRRWSWWWRSRPRRRRCAPTRCCSARCCATCCTTG